MVYMERAKKGGGNHRLFEDWRGRLLEQLSVDDALKFREATEQSTSTYNSAFQQTLKWTTQVEVSSQ